MSEATVLMAAPKVRRAALKPRAHLTRAHLALQDRPESLAAFTAAAEGIASATSQALGVSLTAATRLADATIDARSTLATNAVFAVLEFTQLGATALLELDGHLAGAILEKAAGSEGQIGPLQLTRIDEAALGWVVLTALAEARRVPLVEKRFGPRFVTLLTSTKQALEHLSPTRHLAAVCSVQLGDVRGVARLVFPALALQTALVHESVSSVPMEPSVAAASFEFRCQAGQAQLTRADVASLCKGDVIVLGSARMAGPMLLGELTLQAPRFSLVGALDESGFTFTRALQRASPESIMQKTDEELPIDVHVELTRVSFTLEQLGALRAGSVIPLQVSATQPVTLRISDRAVAKAELVDIEGELGVRILSLL